MTPHIEISARKSSTPFVETNQLGDTTVTPIVRYIAELRVYRDGQEPQVVNDTHVQAAIGGAEVRPHKTPAEALECARQLAADRWPDAEVREGGDAA